jgi:adenosylcobyric acid synthase
MTVNDYLAYKPQAFLAVQAAYDSLAAEYEVMVLEGAGSPAEVNLKDRDIVNMDVARAVDAPVLLVGDIDRGGVFAAFVGTIELLEPDERARIAAFVVNKFRGDRALLEPGLDFLRARTGIPVLGVLPYLRGLRIADEDSVSLDERPRTRRAGPGDLDVAVVRLPRISNFDDLEPLEHERGVVVRYAERAAELRGADLVIIPGSKSTIPDLAWLEKAGFAEEIAARAGRGEPVLGICGGCQMLGGAVEDPLGTESEVLRADGLGLLPLSTRFTREKVTTQARARAVEASFLQPRDGAQLAGYEIHMGVTGRTDGGRPAFEVVSRNERPCAVPDGAVGEGGAVVGTMLHGLLENDGVRAALLDHLRARRGLPAAPVQAGAGRQASYDRLARAVGEAFDRDLLARIVGLDLPRPERDESAR